MRKNKTDSTDLSVWAPDMDLCGRFAGNLKVLISLEGASNLLGIGNLLTFLINYAQYDLDGLMVASSIKETPVNRKFWLIPDYEPYLELGLLARLDYLRRHHEGIGRKEIEVAEMLSRHVPAQEAEKTEDFSKDWRGTDVYVSPVCKQLYMEYMDAWKSGPHRIHCHEGKGKFYYPKDFKNFEADDRKTMALVVRAFSGHHEENLEPLVYRVLMGVTDFDRLNNIEGITLEECKRNCPY